MSIIVGGLVIVAAWPAPVELPPVPVVIAGYGQPSTPPPPTPLAPIQSQWHPKLPELPPVQMIIAGYGDASPPPVPAGTILRSPFAISPQMPELPPVASVIAGYGQQGIPSVDSKPGVIRAIPLVPESVPRLPPRGGVFAGVRDPLVIGIPSAEAFGVAKFNLSINSIGLPSSEAFGIPTVTGGMTLVTSITPAPSNTPARATITKVT